MDSRTAHATSARLNPCRIERARQFRTRAHFSCVPAWMRTSRMRQRIVAVHISHPVQCGGRVVTRKKIVKVVRVLNVKEWLAIARSANVTG